MAADLHKEAKTFSVAKGKSGERENVYGRLYSRLRTVENGTAKNQIEWFFGLRRTEEKYVKDSQQGDDTVFRRTHKTSFNGLRTKTTEYHELAGKKSEHRSYLGGLFGGGKKYGSDGRLLGTSWSDPFGTVEDEKTPDGRRLEHKQTDIGGWHSSRRETLLYPDGKVAKWRTMERKMGSYSMKVVPDKDGKGETKIRGFGNLSGKNWLFKRSVHYNFETEMKTVTYSGLFGIRRRTKDRPMTDNELEKVKGRDDRKNATDNAWKQHEAAGVANQQKGAFAQQDPYAKLAASLGIEDADRGLSVEQWLERIKQSQALNAAGNSPSLKTPPAKGNMTSYGQSPSPVTNLDATRSTDERLELDPGETFEDEEIDNHSSYSDAKSMLSDDEDMSSEFGEFEPSSDEPDTRKADGTFHRSTETRSPYQVHAEAESQSNPSQEDLDFVKRLLEDTVVEPERDGPRGRAGTRGENGAYVKAGEEIKRLQNRSNQIKEQSLNNGSIGEKNRKPRPSLDEREKDGSRSVSVH